MDENLNAQFEAMTENMALEKLYDQLENRAEFARRITRNAAEIYRMAREAGVPRGLSEEMAKDYWKSEMTPGNIYVIEDKGL